ncbi:MAG: hypothetical protein KAR40_11520 [Candidatus Sabulitectum sp.]|nr:hypothetical protein [Candidatus Sabulitectum sp.]
MQLFLSNSELVETLQWDFSQDSIPPELSIYSAEVDYSTMQALVEIECTDTLSGIEKIVLSMDSLESIELVFREDSLWNCSIDFLPFSGETVSVDICAVDSAGNETKENFEVSVLQRPAVVFSSVYPSGTVYDHTPVLQIFADFENPIPGWTAVAMLSGDGFLQELAPYVVDGDIIQFYVEEFLQDGEYRAKVQILEPDGVIVGEHRWNFTVETMTTTTTS